MPQDYIVWSSNFQTFPGRGSSNSLPRPLLFALPSNHDCFVLFEIFSLKKTFLVMMLTFSLPAYHCRHCRRIYASPVAKGLNFIVLLKVIVYEESLFSPWALKKVCLVHGPKETLFSPWPQVSLSSPWTPKKVCLVHGSWRKSV